MVDKKQRRLDRAKARRDSQKKSPTYDPNLVVEDKHPKIENSINPDNMPFRWCFLSNLLNWNHDDYGWKIYKNDLKKFLDEIQGVIHEKYAGKTFGQINRDPTNHSGPYKLNLNSDQKKVLKLYMDINNVPVYHIALSIEHRLIGYLENNMFYPILNDIKHNFSPGQ
ncbi:MAG TPA: hypothetical protein PLZ05_01535 [Alphaproteobacteria bacterium]|nr:hypothetical protein [Alphaproteobacteria bacterium]